MLAKVNHFLRNNNRSHFTNLLTGDDPPHADC